MKVDVQLSPIEQTVFYALDKAIKSYRQFAHRNIRNNNLKITIDQWLVLKTIQDHPKLNQREIASHVFKDYASITRIIELLVRQNYLTRSFHNEDRRRFQLKLTANGRKIYRKLVPIVHQNRSSALAGLKKNEIEVLYKTLNKITLNCT